MLGTFSVRHHSSEHGSYKLSRAIQIDPITGLYTTRTESLRVDSMLQQHRMNVLNDRTCTDDRVVMARSSAVSVAARASSAIENKARM